MLEAISTVTKFLTDYQGYVLATLLGIIAGLVLIIILENKRNKK